MRYSLIAFSLYVATAVSASAQTRQSTYESLERIAVVAARLEREFCEPGLDHVFQGALDGVNAMPTRAGLSPLHMNRPGIDDFAETYGDLLEASDDDALIERAAVEGMIAAIDPGGAFYADHTQFDRSGAIYITLAGGAGAPFITEVQQDGPAARAGVQVGDLLIAIDGEPTQGQRREDVIRRLNGEINSAVTLTLERGGAPITTSIQRARITSDDPSVQWRVIGGAGLISISAFKENTSNLLSEAITSIQRETQVPSGYIIDLRNSPGGLLDQVVAIADQFIAGGPIVTTRPVAACHASNIQRYNGRRNDDAGRIPLIVLVNGGTASGAEAVAAALRDRRNATIIGQTTLGNASVHTVIPLNGGRDGYLKITTAAMYAPSDTTWQSTGLTPHIVTEPRSAGADPALARAIALLAENR